MPQFIHPHIYPNANSPIVSILSGNNGVDQLDPNLTINGTTVTPMFRYKGGDADGTNLDPWTYGEILPLVGGTVPTYNTGSPLLGPNDDSVKFNVDGYYEYTDGVFADITTQDILFDVVFKTGSMAGTQVVMGKISTEGWYIELDTNSLNIVLDDGTVVTTSSVSLTPYTWYYAFGYVNRDEASTDGSVIYVNDTAGTGVDQSTTSSTLTNTESFAIGAQSGDSNHTNATVAYAAMWIGTDLIQAGASGPAEIAAIAKERFLKLTGFWSPKGTVTYARATEAVLSKREGSATKLYTVGDGWPRMDKVVDSASTELIGYRVETEDENELLYSEDFDDASWVKTRTTVDSDALLAPNKELTADGLVGDAVSNTHYIEQAIASTATEHIFAVFAKAGDQDWLCLEAPTVANANAYYDLSTCALGTVGIGATAYIEDYGDGWCRAILIYTGGAPSHAHRIYSAEADGDITFTGDGTTVNTWIWGATHTDEGLGYPTSYIKTEASTVTRVKDDLEITGLVLESARRIASMILLPGHNNINYQSLYVIDDLSSNNLIESRVTPTDIVQSYMYSGGVYQGSVSGSSDISDGIIHYVEYKYKPGYNVLKVDGVIEGTGTPASIPLGLVRLCVGQNVGTYQLNGVIGQVKIYKM